ncbi:MAG TPA: flagellar motor protein [Spirochaetia bacterium]|nr:flagellar motor protein [Spirochaetia bacterium]
MARGRSEVSTLIGIVAGFGALLIGFMFERGNLIALIGPSALIVILGGTFGALTTSFAMKDIVSIPRLFSAAMQAAEGPTSETLEQLCEYAERARREGLLSLEEVIEDMEDPFLKKGLQLVIDGTDPEIISTIIQNDIYLWEHKRKNEAAIFEAAGGFSPTMGIIGTVMGLVIVLQTLGGDTSELGHSIATAFIATLYGISFANLIWLPIGNKLKLKLRQEKLAKEMIMTGILAIQQGENPSIIRRKLESYMEN